MNKNILVSVIVPIHNSEKYLRACLDSLINQSLKEIEIICINDGSTDKSELILDEYKSKDKRIIVINQNNSGQSSARNKGIKIAQGEYIGFVDSDDFIDLNYYEKLYNYAYNNNADIAVSGIIRFHKFRKKFHLKFDQASITKNKNLKFQLCEVPEKSYIWNKIYNTQKLKAINLLFEEGIIYEDCIFTPQAIYYLEKLVTVPDVYYHYRRHLGSTVTKRDKKSQLNSTYARDKANEFIKNHGIDISQHETITKKYKFLGLTIFKIITKRNNKKLILFNILNFKI